MPKNRPTSYLEGYQQALEDFGIAHLLAQLQTYSNADFDAAWMNLTQTELESLAAISIRDLTANLDGKAISGYLNAIRHASTDISPNLFHPPCRTPSVALPETFPFVNTPRCLYGDKLRWIPDGDKTDWGIAIGRFYSFAPHRGAWTWCYLISLDPLSPSYAKTVADTAWEDDLEPMEEAA
ncbi:hypothetical protein [Microseira wollei]|uniref:Uncharacterized protein n=1 Tax=Microseira wollei NIES-4236 TaxID=2530354 RepID=A0AAV3XP55_9CYAN|nr:hypothetical protein [Microseira wollei]GET42479.1 hypothetical protein MiSe_72960 [Microseira wollei NIES-4236]